MNAIKKLRADGVEGEGDRIGLMEENRRLKKENEHLMEFLAGLNEEMHIAIDFWRSAYLSLARQNSLARKEFQKDQFGIMGG